MSAMDQINTLMAAGPATRDMDPTTKRLLEEQKKRLEQSSTDELLTGVGKPGASGLLSSQPAYDFSAALGGDSAISGQQVGKAIIDRNIARNTENIDRMKRELALTAPARDAGRLRQVGQGLGAQAEVQVQNNKIMKQFELDKRRVEQFKQQQRDAMLAAVLGVVGGGLGIGIAAATGGAAAPMVAGAGAKAGNMAGNFANMSNKA